MRDVEAEQRREETVAAGNQQQHPWVDGKIKRHIAQNEQAEKEDRLAGHFGIAVGRLPGFLKIPLHTLPCHMVEILGFGSLKAWAYCFLGYGFLHQIIILPAHVHSYIMSEAIEGPVPDPGKRSTRQKYTLKSLFVSIFRRNIPKALQVYCFPRPTQHASVRPPPSSMQ